MNDIVSDVLNIAQANQVLHEFQRLLDELPVSINEQVQETVLRETLNLMQASSALGEFQQLLEQLPASDAKSIGSSEKTGLLDLTEANRLIQDFKNLRLDDKPKRKKSFLEILNLERREAINSNILAFFLNTKEVHGLKDLLLQALLTLANKPQQHHINTVSVEIEVSCGHQKGRIDLLIKTSDHVILIENKLFHHANNNPFEDYIGYTEQEFPQHDKTFIVLGLEKPQPFPDNFIWVSHFDLAKAIRTEIGQYWLQAEQYYLPLLFDYLNAIETFNTESEFGKMEQAIVDFYRTNCELLEKIEENIHHVQTYYEKEARKIIEQPTIQTLNIFPDIEDNWLYDEGLSEIGGGFTSKLLKSANSNHNIVFWIGKSTKETILAFERYKNSWGQKSCKLAREFLAQHSIEDFAKNDEYIYLLRLPETISAEEFAVQAAPIIQKLLDIHGIDVSTLSEEADEEDI